MLITKDSCDLSDLELFIKKCRRIGYRDHKDIKQLEIDKTINEKWGKFFYTYKGQNIIALSGCHEFSFLQSLRMGGIGSKRMIIEETSQNFLQYINKISDINYANIELRPQGIIVLINKGLHNFNWVIPYRQLVIYKTDRLSIHAQGKYICFKKNILYKENKKFISKMINLRAVDQEKYLKENTEVQVIVFKDEIVQVTSPDFMELIITETDPGFRGDTASGGSKPATLETGAVIRVPFFVNQGDKVRVDTRTDTYLERVK